MACVSNPDVSEGLPGRWPTRSPGGDSSDLLETAAVCIQTVNLCGRRLLQVERLKGYLLANGFRLVPRPADARHILLVGCAFNTHTEQVSLKALEEHRRDLGPSQQIFILEGVADTCGERLVQQGLCAARHIVPTTEFARLDRYFARNLRFDQSPEANVPGQYDGHSPSTIKAFAVNQAPSTTAVFSVQVGAGCLDNCTYCGDRPIVGPLRSRPLGTILAQVDQALALGYRSFELIGDDVGCYGLDTGHDLPTLLRHMSERRYVERLSLLEVNVKYLVRYEPFLREYLRLGTLRKIAVAFQSGSDRVLSLMARGYGAGDVRRIARLLSDTGVWKHAHVIIGFPTETDQEWEQSCDLLLEGRFESATLFLYQDRPGTPATALVPKVPEAEKGHRLERARLRLASAGFTSATRDDKLQVCRVPPPL